MILDASIALCYLDFIVKIPDQFLGITSILTNVMQVLTVVDYIKIYREQRNLAINKGRGFLINLYQKSLSFLTFMQLT